MGFLTCAIFASAKITRLKRLLARAAKRRSGYVQRLPADPARVAEDEDPLPDRGKLAAQREDAGEERSELARMRLEETLRELKERVK